MANYARYGHKDFLIAGGYKSNLIKRFFKKKYSDWSIKVIDTGINTMTGGRIKKLKKYLKNEPFFLTYGDGLSNINIKKLLKFHKKNKKFVTLTAVRPPARFGVVKTKGSLVKYFKEKSKGDEGWINGGFFVMEPKFINFIKNNQTYLEREPLEKVTKLKQLTAYKHTGYWQCVDTKRDLDKVRETFKINVKK